MATGGSSPCEGEDLAGACVCATASATWTTQNLFIALDRSATMAGDRWNRALETLMVLFADDALSHAGVALATFPDTAVPLACNGVTCSPEACGVPLVELARLTRESPPQDAQEYALVNALRALTPDGPAPPLTAALDGALEQAANHVSEHPDERAQVVLVTGGEGNACSEFSAGLAARAYTEQGIRTHVLGFEDGNVPLLDDIAINGGTDRALLLGNDPEANAADLIGLTHLLPGDISCDFALPLGENLDLWNIRVTLTTVNGEVLRLVQVPASGACPDRAPSMPESSFYFNDPVNPTAIVLCPAACNALSSGDYDRLDVSIGCARIDP
jgi:hypothetical protein